MLTIAFFISRLCLLRGVYKSVPFSDVPTTPVMLDQIYKLQDEVFDLYRYFTLKGVTFWSVTMPWQMLCAFAVYIGIFTVVIVTDGSVSWLLSAAIIVVAFDLWAISPLYRMWRDRKKIKATYAAGLREFLADNKADLSATEALPSAHRKWQKTLPTLDHMADPKLLIKPKKGEWRVTGVQFHVPSGYDSWSTPDPSERALTIMLSNGQGEGCYLVLGSARNMRDWIAKRFKQLTSERFVSGTHFWSALSEIDVSGLVSSKYQAEAKAFAATLAEELGLQFRDRTPVHFWGERGRDGGYVLHGIKSGEQQYTVVSFTALQALATSMSEVCKLAFPGRSNPLLAN